MDSKESPLEEHKTSSPGTVPATEYWNWGWAGSPNHFDDYDSNGLQSLIELIA